MIPIPIRFTWIFGWGRVGAAAMGPGDLVPSRCWMYGSETRARLKLDPWKFIRIRVSAIPGVTAAGNGDDR